MDNNLYKTTYWRKPWQYLLLGLWLCVGTASGVWAQAIACGPNQILTSYYSGATSVFSTTGTATSTSALIGGADGNTATLNANSGVTLDIGSVLAAGSTLTFSYKSADLNAPMQVLVSATGTANSFTNVAQLPGSTTTMTGSITLPFATRYVQLLTTGTIYYPDAVIYTVYKCVTNPAPICATGQTLLTYPKGSSTTGPPDSQVSTLGGNSSLVYDLGSVVTAGNVLSLTYYSKYSSLSATPAQVLVSTTGTPGSFTTIGSFQPTSGSAHVINGTLTLPLDARYVQLVTFGANSIYYIDAVSYLAYSCVNSTIPSCAAGQQAVSYPVGSTSVNSVVGSVQTSGNVTGLSDGYYADMSPGSSLVADLGSNVGAGTTLTFTHIGGQASFQVLTSSSAGGPFTYIGTLGQTGGDGYLIDESIRLPLAAQYIKVVPPAPGVGGSVQLDAISYPVYQCVTIPSTSCPAGKTSFVTQMPVTQVIQGSSSAFLGAPDGVSGGVSTNSSAILSFPTVVSAGNQLNVYYSSNPTFAPWKIQVATNVNGPFTDVIVLPGASPKTVSSFVLPVDAKYIKLITYNSGVSVDAITYPTYSCISNPASCPIGQQSVAYQMNAASVNSTTGTVSNSGNAIGAFDNQYATISASSALTLDLGNVLTAGNKVSVNYYTSGTGVPASVQVATSAAGPYTYIGGLSNNSSYGTSTLTLPVDARYVQIVTSAQSASYLIDGLTYWVYNCVNPPSANCGAGQQQLSYPAGPVSVSNITGKVDYSSNIIGPEDNLSVNFYANSTMELDMGSSLPAGTVLTFNTQTQDTNDDLQVWVSNTSGSAYTYIGSITPSTTANYQQLTLPLTARYILLKSGASVYIIDAVTYPVYTCASLAGTACGAGQLRTYYYKAAGAVIGTTGTVTSATYAIGFPDGNVAALGLNSSITLDMSSTITAGNTLNITFSTPNNNPLQVLVATNASGPFTDVGQLTGRFGLSTQSLVLPLDTRYVKLSTSSSEYFNFDGVTYNIYTCVNNSMPTCAGGQTLTSYYSGAQAIGTTTGSVQNATNATGSVDGSVAAMGTNASMVLNMGSVLQAGSLINITYLSGNTTNPLYVATATSLGGPYSYIAQLAGTTAGTTASLILPLDAQYIQLQTTGTNYSVDAVTQAVYSCIASPAISCPTGQVSSSYQAGVQSVGAITGTVSSTANIVGVPDGAVSTINANSSLITDLGNTIAAGSTVYVSYSSVNTTAPLQVLVSTSAGGSFTNIAQVSGSTAATTMPVTLPVSARYIQLQTTSTAYTLDAITYPVYTCVAPISSTCSAGQQSVSYQAGAQSVGTTVGAVGSSSNLTGTPDGAVAALPANSSVILDLGTVVTGGNSLRITYSSTNVASPMQVLVATSLSGPYTNIDQLPGSTSMTTQTVNLPINARYVQLATTGTAYNPDAITYPVYTCVTNPVAICPVGQQAISYNSGATGVNGATNVTNPSYGTGTPDGAYAVMAANGVLTLDLGSVLASGNTLTLNYRSGNLAAPMQVLVTTTTGGPYTNIGQMPASTANATGGLTLPVDARYVQLITSSTSFSVDAVTRPVYTCISSTLTSGIVYLDGNVNGVLNSTELGVGGITVKAYDASGNLVATTTTSAGNPALNIPAGYYSFNNLVAGQPYKLEFTNWPSQYSSSIFGSDNGTSVQFIQGSTLNNDLGLYVPSNVCSFLPNPRIVMAKGLTGGSTSVDSYSYYDRGGLGYTSSTQTLDIPYSQIGVPLGISSQRPYNWVYMSPISTNIPSVFPLAPAGSSAIYIANYNGPNGTQDYQGQKFLVKLSDLGIDVGPTSTTIGGNPFGVQGLGGLDFSQSGDTMYVVNMYKGTLVGVDVSQVDYNNLPATAPTNAFEITPPTSLANCSGGVYRPTALKQYGGKIYMGGVCDAEISGSNADLKGVVLAYDPVTQTWSKALDYPINFTTGEITGTGEVQVGWATSGLNQPVLLDLAFADNGMMVIGTTNRLVYGLSTSASQHGYIMGAWPNGDGTYTLENAGQLGPYTSTANLYTGTDGPGGRWFFQQSGVVDTGYKDHTYTFEGGLYIKSGTNEVIAGSTDPGTVSSYGAAYLSLTNGSAQYFTKLNNGVKLTRITGTDQVCDAVPPLEIGNRVWKDTNGNGIQDAGEPSLAGVIVELRNAIGDLIATAVTDANGNYIFSNQPNLNDTPSQKYNLPITQLTNYTLRISSLGSNPSTNGLTLTGITQAPGETAGSTNTGATIDNNDAFLVNGLPTITLKTGVDGSINHTFDFGFIPTSFDLALTKKLATGQASVVKPGSNVTFTVTMINQGTQPAYTIQITDYIPAGFVLNDANWNATGNLATLKTPISGSLAAGDSVKVNITFTVSSTASGPIINRAEISSADNDTDPNNTPPTDIDSTPDQNPGNDAGGTPNSGSDNSVNGNGTGTPGDTNPTTDEDDADPAIIYVQPCTLGVNLLTTEAHCGKADGQATVTVNTGAAPFTYSWSTGASTSAITGLSGGQTFTVTVSDANGCQDVLVGTIQSTGGPSLTATTTAASCLQANGSATVTASGGTGSYTYLWSTGATTATLSNVVSGTYTVKVTDGVGCVSSLAVIVPAISPLSVVATPTSASCLGANGSVTLSVSGGSAAYSYQWDNGATTQNLTTVAGGTYKVNVTDANGCTAVATAVVLNTGAPTVIGTPINPACFGTSTGSITLQASGGSGAYSYQWDNGSTAQSLTGVQAGIYNVVVTDAAGCRSGASFTLVAPSRIVADIQSLSAVCNAQGGVTGGTLQVVSVVGGTPGYSYLWSNSSTATSLSGLAAGTYSLTVTDSKGCIALGQAVIDPWPTCALASLGDYVWFDTNKDGQQGPTETGVASVTAVLYDATTNQPISTTVTDATGKYLFTNLNPGSYYVKFTAPTGMTFTTANVGNDASDSDAGVGGQTGIYSLTAGQQDLTVDAGLIPLPAGLGDYVWLDTNKNGVQDNGETPIAGVTVTLYVNGIISATTVTNASGFYSFTGLTPGNSTSYAVGFTAPTGYTVTSQYSGSDRTIDSNADPITGKTESITLAPGEFNPTLDAGFIPTPVFDLALVKKLAAGQSANVVAGGTVTFTVTVYNQGNVDATNVQVTDYIPAGLTLNDAAWTASGSTATLNSVIASLPASQSVSRNITFTVSNSFVGSLTNTAEISSASNAQNLPDKDSTPDSDPTNDGTPVNDDTTGDHKNNPSQDEDDSDPEVITVTPAPVFDLALTKTLAPGQSRTVVPGGSVTFTVTVYNQGNVDATNVQVTDYIPAGLTLNDANWTAVNGKATLNSVIASLPAGQSTTRNITFTVSNSFVGSLTNTAEISNASNAQNLPDKDSTPDNDPTNDGTPVNDDTSGDHKNNPSQDEDDSDPEVITVTPAPVFDLALTKTLAAGQSRTVVPGGSVTFTVTVYNQGNVDATNVQVTDYIPSGLTLNDAAWTASGSTATLNSLIASLPAGQSTTRNITFTVSDKFVGSLTNVAEISSASNAQNLPDKDSTPDSDPTNDGTPVNDDTSGDHKNNPSQDEDDSDPEVITVTPAPVFDLALTKTLAPGQSRTVVPGGSVTFTVTVYNQGNVDATNVQVTDYIPTGLTLNDAGWILSNGMATLNNPIASLPAGQSTTRNITFTVSSSFAGGSLTNTAEISSASNAQNLPDKDSTPDSDPTNDGTPVNDDTSGDHKNNPSQDEDDSDPETITVTPLKAALGDYVWYDNNKNGQQDPGEPPAVGVTVTLYNATTNQPISTTVTDGTGHYLFSNLDPGTYYVVFTAPSGATFTTPNTGNDTTDSDAGVGGKTGNYTLVAGQTDLTVDAGLIPQCTTPNCTTIINVK